MMRSFVETAEQVRSVLMYGTNNWHVSTVNLDFLGSANVVVRPRGHLVTGQRRNCTMRAARTHARRAGVRKCFKTNTRMAEERLRPVYSAVMRSTSALVVIFSLAAISFNPSQN